MNNTISKNSVEYIVHSTSKGKVIEPILKTYAHSDGVRAKVTHYSTWSMIYNPGLGKYGIQLKNPTKHDKYGAGKWDMGVAGHNCYIKEKGKLRYLDFDENLVKEAKEEIGIKIKMCKTRKEFVSSAKHKPTETLGFIFEKFHYKTSINNEWVGLGFIITSTTKLKFKDKEVIDFKWLFPEELKTFLEIETNYCSPLPLVFKKAEKFRKSYLHL